MVSADGIGEGNDGRDPDGRVRPLVLLTVALVWGLDVVLGDSRSAVAD